MKSDEFIKKSMAYPAFLVKFMRWKLGFCRRLRAHDPIFVYQMGKVSSRSIYEPLESSYAGAVIHGHGLSENYPSGEVREIYQYLHSDAPPDKVHVISITRDPVARNMSAFFMNFEEYTGVRVEDSQFSMSEIRDLFLKNWPHDGPLDWFDHNILQNFGIDVFAEQFPDCGYAQYEKENVRLLVFRLELDDEKKNDCVREFLDMPDFNIVRTNLGKDQVYGDLYSAFKQTVRLPADYIDRMCNSKYFKHFYDADYIEGVRKRWSE